MTDKSCLNAKYFIDEYVFNCPFCNRNNVEYNIKSRGKFDWSNLLECYVFYIKCSSCRKLSMHLSYEDVATHHSYGVLRFDIKKGEGIDEKFFYSIPTSFFVLDNRIPKILRELITEAEGCLNGNFLTGASACARKIIYELSTLEGAKGNDYNERIKSLKVKRPDVEGDYFDTLVTIQEFTSSKVHEESYDGWESKHLKLILSTVTKILGEMYVLPAIRQDNRKSILKLKKTLIGGTKTKK